MKVLGGYSCLSMMLSLAQSGRYCLYCCVATARGGGVFLKKQSPRDKWLLNPGRQGGVGARRRARLQAVKCFSLRAIFVAGGGGRVKGGGGESRRESLCVPSIIFGCPSGTWC